MVRGFMYMKCPESLNLENQKVGQGLPRTEGEVGRDQGAHG